MSNFFMNRRDEKVITLIVIVLLAIALILLFFVSALLITEYSPEKSYSGSSGKVIIVNLDNVDYISNRCKLVKVPYSIKVPYEVDYMKEYSRKDYSSRSVIRRVQDYLGNDIDEYIVYIENEGHDDEYFEVKFIFEDYYGAEHSYVISKHVEAGEEEKFIYRDIYADRNKHHDFKYEILGNSKTYFRRVSDIEYRWETGYKWERVC